MRLTLRTLLAYLDDTLDPAKTKEIGQKVAESDTAQELIARIKAVTRRRRLTVPPPGKVDANAIAEYLDNALTADQLAEIEQLCLSSEVHLAEVAACHQILTVVMGEPVVVPPTAVQRMYGVVKGRESIPFRRPPVRTAREVEPAPVESKEMDETLRLGLPAYRRQASWTNRLIVIGGAAALAICLVVAVWQLLQGIGATPEDKPAPGVVAQADQKDKTKPEIKKKDDGGKKVEPKNGKKDDGKKEDGKKDDGKKEDGSKGKELKQVPVEPPSTTVTEVGYYEAPPPGQAAAVLLQYQPKEETWLRLLRPKDPKTKTPVLSNQRLVSLPGYRSAVQIDKGVRLTLWGNVLELLPPPPKEEADPKKGLSSPRPPLFESVVELYDHDVLDLDLKLVRGGIRLLSTRSDRAAHIRLRFDNPTFPEAPLVLDVTLPKDEEIFVHRSSYLPYGEPFYKDPKDPKRQGPVALVDLMVVSGKFVDVRWDKADDWLTAKSDKSWLTWNSSKGDVRVYPLIEQPEWFNPAVPVFPKGDPPQVRDIKKGISELSRDLSEYADQGLNKSLTSAEVGTRRLAVRCLLALDQLPKLVDVIGDQENHESRQETLTFLPLWLTYERDNDYRLYNQLKTRYKEYEAEVLMSLLHPYSLDPKHPVTYEALIGYLNNDRLPIRELAYGYLLAFAPAGAKIKYSPIAPPGDWQRAQAEWSRLIPAGKLPPPPKDK